MSNDGNNLKLHDNIKLLGQILGEVIKQYNGEATYQNIEKIRKIAKFSKQNQLIESKELSLALKSLPDEEVKHISRAFSHFLNYANIADQYAQIKKYESYDKSKKGLDNTFLEFMDSKIKTEEIYSAISNLDISLVLTAHPTEVKSRTIIIKHHKICGLLQKLDFVNNENEISKIKKEIKKEVSLIWLTPELNEEKPTPIDEVKWVLAVIENSLWDSVPKYLNKLDYLMTKNIGVSLPIDCSPIKFDSWVGGDRDGNPYVTADVTFKSCMMSILGAMNLYYEDVKQLREYFSLSLCSEKLAKHVNFSKEPYRVILRNLEETINNTRDYIDACLNYQDVNYDNIIQDWHDLLSPLSLCYDSLVEVGAKDLTKGLLVDLIRKVYCFGLSLVRLDIRQNSEKHILVIDCIASQLNLGIYSDWDELKKCDFLLKSISNPKSINITLLKFEEETKEIVETIKVIDRVPRYCLSKYIISMSRNPSDILGVLFLQKIFLKSAPLPVVPLFETLKDLENSHECLDKLFMCEGYQKIVNSVQEVMIGYSDSSKDTGIFSATWAQYQAQEKMVEVANKYNVKLSFFHGRGGSIGRGGWPTHAAINSLPPNTVKGKLRVTQQGEVIDLRFGVKEVACRNLEIFTAATLKNTLHPPVKPNSSWRELMKDMSIVASKSYNSLIFETEKFEDYFYNSTPCKELKMLAIGSRPQSRAKDRGIEFLRAIPWVFSWTQNRVLLPAWLGVEEALSYAKKEGKFGNILKMYEEWPFFYSLINMIEMVLAKSDMDIGNFYRSRLGSLTESDIENHINEKFNKTKSLILDVIQIKDLLQNNNALSASVSIRNPYLLPLHLLQVELLAKIRNEKGDSNSQLNAALLITITGIAAGMKNSG